MIDYCVNILPFFGFQTSLKETIFDVLIYFTQHEDEDVQSKALTGIGMYWFLFFNMIEVKCLGFTEFQSI